MDSNPGPSLGVAVGEPTGLTCGGTGNEESLAVTRANAGQNEMRLKPPTINGLQVPVVTEYTYLGVVITCPALLADTPAT